MAILPNCYSKRYLLVRQNIIWLKHKNNQIKLVILDKIKKNHPIFCNILIKIVSICQI